MKIYVSGAHITDGIFPLHCFTCAKKVVLESDSCCNWIVNYAMTRTLNEQWHEYTCIEMIRAQQYFTSAHFSGYMIVHDWQND